MWDNDSDDDEFFQAFYDSCNESNFDYGSSNSHHLNGYDDDEPGYHLTDDWGRTHSFYTESDARNYFYQHEDDFEDQSY